MRLRKILGAFLVSSPFLGIAAFCLAAGGLNAFAFVFGVGTVLVGSIFAGLWLLSENN